MWLWLVRISKPTAKRSLSIRVRPTKTVTITINGDVLDEFDETFFVDLTNASGARIDDGQGLATIVDDDALPTLSIGDATIDPEGDQGVQFFALTVTLSVGQRARRDGSVRDAGRNGGSRHRLQLFWQQRHHCRGRDDRERSTIPSPATLSTSPAVKSSLIDLTNPDFATLNG